MTTILLAEDEHEIAELVRDVLETEGYDVVLAGDGREALAQLARKLPDLLLSDIMMPHIDGLELCHRMKVNPRFREIPVILMSAFYRPLERARSECDGILLKPFEIPHLLDQIRSALAHQSV